MHVLLGPASLKAMQRQPKPPMPPAPPVPAPPELDTPLAPAELDIPLAPAEPAIPLEPPLAGVSVLDEQASASPNAEARTQYTPLRAMRRFPPRLIIALA